VELNAFEFLETIEDVFCFVTPYTMKAEFAQTSRMSYMSDARVIYKSVVIPHMEKMRSQISLLAMTINMQPTKRALVFLSLWF